MRLRSRSWSQRQRRVGPDHPVPSPDRHHLRVCFCDEVQQTIYIHYLISSGGRGAR